MSAQTIGATSPSPSPSEFANSIVHWRDGVRAQTETETAEALGLSVATLRAWRQRMTGPGFVRFGRSVRYLSADVEAFIQASRVDTSSPMVPDDGHKGMRAS